MVAKPVSSVHVRIRSDSESEYRLFEIDFSSWVVENVSRGLGKARGSLLAHGCLVSLFFFFFFFFIFSVSQPSSHELTSSALEGWR